jgi:hypothetical protein
MHLTWAGRRRMRTAFPGSLLLGWGNWGQNCILMLVMTCNIGEGFTDLLSAKPKYIFCVHKTMYHEQLEYWHLDGIHGLAVTAHRPSHGQHFFVHAKGPPIRVDTFQLVGTVLWQCSRQILGWHLCSPSMWSQSLETIHECNSLRAMEAT